MDFNTVSQFEQRLAEWWGAPHAVAVDCCTHAVELCLRHTDAISATCPQHTTFQYPLPLTNWVFSGVSETIIGRITTA